MSMDESPCLRRSFSNPSEITHVFQQADPIRALGESISFGRYMSESLAWERWSTFSHNRYLEEAEKYSKPGSVAKMKAHFEAHYSRIGAKKRAALEDANKEPSVVEPEVQNTIENSLSNADETPAIDHTTICEIGAKKRAILEETNNEPIGVEPKVENTIESSSSLNTEKTLVNDHTTICEITGKEIPDVELQSSAIVSSSASLTPINKLEDKELHIVESLVNIKTTDGSFEVQVHERKDAEEVNASVCKSSTEMKVNRCMDMKKSDIINCTPEKKLPVKELEKVNSKSKQKSADLSLKQSVKSNVSKLSSTLARLSTPARPKMEGKATPNERKSGKESLDKRKSVSRLINMSTNSDVKKTSPLSRKAAIGKVFTPLGKIIRDRFTPSPAPSKEFRNSVVRHPCVTPQSETRRSKVALEKSFSRSKTLDQKLKSPFTGNMNSSVQSPTVCSSFKLRTEERAERRRELLQKRLEKEAENLQQLEKAKVKPKTDTTKSSLGVNLKASASTDIRPEVLSDNTKKVKPKTDTRKSSLGVNLKASASTDIRTEVLSGNTKKIASPRTQLSKSGTKLASDVARGQTKPTSVITRGQTKPTSDIAQATCPRPPQKSVNSKLSIEKSKTVSTQSCATPTKKKRHENTSPNIL